MKKLKTILALSPMVIGLAFAMDIYVPAVPKIATLFKVSASEMQLTLTFFMLTASLMQLVIGPLSDQYGRKWPGYLVIMIYAIGSLLCSSAQSAHQLIFYRGIQAIGACGMLVVAFATVRDLHDGQDSAQVYSLLNGMIAFSPMLAPFIGSYLDVHYNWPSTFQFLAILALAAIVLKMLLMPESLEKSRRKKIDCHIFKEYKRIITHKTFFNYNLANVFGMSYLYLFCSLSPYIIIRRLHIPEIDYGYYFCFMGISFLIGSLLSAWLVRKIGIYHTVVIGFLLSLIGGLTMSIWYFITGLTIHNFIYPMLIIGIGGTLGMGAGGGGCMQPFKQIAGAAASVGGFTRFAFAAILGSIVITPHVASTLPLAIPAILFSIIGLMLFKRNKKVLVSPRA